jgi:hypothetical protein
MSDEKKALFLKMEGAEVVSFNLNRSVSNFDLVRGGSSLAIMCLGKFIRIVSYLKAS